MPKQDRTVTINIEGYGEIEITRPKKLTPETFLDAVADTVAKTVTLLSPQYQGERFHPALGKGGHVERRSDQEAAT